MRRIPLGELCTIEKGKTGINKAIPGKYPLVVTSADRKSHNEYQFDADAVVIPLVSSTGHGHKSLNRIHFQTGKFAVGSILCAVIPKDKTQLSAEYLYRYLDLNREKELVARMKGMANVTLPLKEIEQIEIPLLTIDQQREFVKSYKSLEIESSKLSSELTHQLSLLKQLRQAFLREAMQGKLVPQNPNDEPGSELLKTIRADKEHLIKEKKIKKEKEFPPIKPKEIPFEIPKSWVWCRLGEILTEIKYGTSQHCDYEITKNSRVLRIPNVSSGVINDDDLKYTNLTTKEISELALENGDILIIRSNGSRHLVGKTVLVTEKFEGYTYAGYLVRWRFNKRFISQEYLWATTTAPYFRELIETPLRTTVGINNINTEEMSNLLIPLPPQADQKTIVTKLKQLMHYCDELEKSIKQSQTQNEQLLQRVLSEALQPKKQYEINNIVSLAVESQ